MTGRGRSAAPLALAALAPATLTGLAYWPGLMTWDPVRQYGEALSGDIDDWHPPVMQRLWQWLIALHPGPAPMLLLQLALYWGGFVLLAAALHRQGARRTAWAVLACGLLPLGLALTGAILKDILMTGALLVATGLLALQSDASSGRGVPTLPQSVRAERSRSTFADPSTSLRADGLGWLGISASLGAATLLLFAATLRFNAFTACLPLMLALLPAEWRRGWRLAPAALIAAALLIAAMPVANRLIGAKPSGVELSLVLFDLGGITEHAGVSVFPAEFDVADPVRVNHRCYRPDKWDSYSDWVDPECPLGFSAWNDDVAPAGVRPYPTLLHAILAHPLAYAEHRLSHFAINIRLRPDPAERPVPNSSAPNDWGFHITPNPLVRALDTLAVTTAATPLGWPIVWIAIAAGALIAGAGLPRAGLIVPIALSSILYGCGYLVVSVASELRYHLWTELAALIAAVLVAAEWREVSARRRWLACLPLGIALAAAITARL